MHAIVIFVVSRATDDFLSNEDGAGSWDVVLVREDGDRHVDIKRKR